MRIVKGPLLREKHRAKSMEQRVRSKNPEFGRKAIKIDFLSTTD